MKKRVSVAVCVALLVLLAIAAVIAVPMSREYLYPREYSEYVTRYCEAYSVPEDLVYAVIRTESSFDPNAESRVGALGLMQLMPDTLDWLSRLLDEDAPTGEITDPETNIKYGTYYLRHLYDRFGDWGTAIAAYNAGHGRVAQWLDNPEYSVDGRRLDFIPFQETRNYVNRISDARKHYKELYYGE